jgi:hypothetical protein
MAATAKHAGKINRVKLLIEVLPVVFWLFVINPAPQPIFRRPHGMKHGSLSCPGRGAKCRDAPDVPGRVQQGHLTQRKEKGAAE